MSSRVYEDPIVAEIHAIRDAMVEQHEGDHRRLMQQVRQNQEKSSRTILPAPPDSRNVKFGIGPGDQSRSV